MTPHHETARKILEDCMTRKGFPHFWEGDGQCSEFARGQIEDAWAKIIADASQGEFS
jgi:hypothetical protein